MTPVMGWDGTKPSPGHSRAVRDIDDSIMALNGLFDRDG